MNSPPRSQVLDASAGMTADQQPVLRDSGAQDAPLSFAQQRLWFLDQLEPGNTVYNLPSATRILGPLDVDVLERSLSLIIERHASLRTVFPTVGDEPVQRILPPKPVSLAVEDLGSGNQAEVEAEFQRRRGEEFDHRFDLERGPLLRIRLLRLNAKEHVLITNTHHIIYDLWSHQVFLRELAAACEAFSENRVPSLAPLPLQYVDFAKWQRECIEGSRLRKQLAYWTNQLAGELPPLRLPADKPRPEGRSIRGRMESFALPASVSARLKQLGRQHGTTFFMTMAAIFAAWLKRHTGSEDLVIGSPVSNRGRSEVEELIGFFVNLLPLRIDGTGDPGFSEWLQRVRQTALEAYDHQDVPFERLVSALQPERRLSHDPLFQVMFDVQMERPAALDAGGLRFVPLEVETRTAKFDLSLFVKDLPDQLGLTFEYKSDLFERETIQRWLQSLGAFIEGVLERPLKRVSRLPVFTSAQRLQLLEEWNNTESGYPKESSIAELFQIEVERTPDAVALVEGDQKVTYAELNCHANRLAHRLRQAGAGPDILIGLCSERSIEMIVGLLAILKAGGAYLPLDPEYPRERLELMLNDARPKLVLASRRLQDHLPWAADRVIGLDDSFDSFPATNPILLSTADDLAYVIYTSGSTGTPKGTLIPQRGVLRLVRETNFARFGPDEVFLQAAPLGFDASTFEIWGALLNGARLVLLPHGPQSLDLLGKAIERHRVTTLWLTAGLFHLMMDEHPEKLRGIRQMLAGGDVLSVPHVRKFLEMHPEARLINGYGPTENTTFTCCAELRAGAVLGESVPIGRPISNTRVYVLDARQEPVPIGVPGELYIGGDGLARGYLNQPSLTAEKFVPNPFRPGERLYRTGDLVRWLADGQIEFLGRLDQQVKIRGFRIEPAEVEAALAAHPSMRDNVVVARPDPASATKRLVAYVVPSGDGCDPEALRLFLKARLPEYMIPSVFVPLSALPLTANGKVDRQALPEPEVSAQSSRQTAAPATPEEEKLAAIWREVLGLAEIGVHDNFFALGGHSLLATQVVARIAKAFQVQLPVRCLFEAPTISTLAATIRMQAGNGLPAASAPIRRRAPRKPPGAPPAPVQTNQTEEPGFELHAADVPRTKSP